MKKFILITISSLLIFQSCSQHNSTEEKNNDIYTVVEKLEMEHPSGFFKEAGKRFTAGEKNDAAFLFYLGELRYKYYLSANPNFQPDGEPAVYSSLQSSLGEEINYSLNDSVDNYISIMDSVISWDKSHDFIFFSKSKFPEKHQEILNGLIELRQYVFDNKEDIIKQLKENKEEEAKYKSKKHE